MGYGFYLNYVPEEEVPMLLELNRSGFLATKIMYFFHFPNDNAIFSCFPRLYLTSFKNQEHII